MPSPAQNTNHNNSDSPTYLSVSEAARLLGISPASMRRLENADKIKATRNKNKYRQYLIEDVTNLKTNLQRAKETKLKTKLQKNQTNQAARHRTPQINNVASKKSKTEYKNNSLTKQAMSSDISKTSKYVLSGFLFLLLATLALGIATPTKQYLGEVLGISDAGQSSNDYKKLKGLFRAAESIKNVPSVLASRTRNAEFSFSVNVPSIFKAVSTFEQDVTLDESITVAGLSSLAGGTETPTLTFTGVGTMNELDAIDDVTETTLENALDIAGEVVSVGDAGLTDVEVADGVIDGANLADTIEYAGDWNFAGTWNIDNTEVTATAAELNSIGSITEVAVVTGGVIFGNGSAAIQDETNFFWNDTTNRLGLGTASPTALLTVGKAGNAGVIDMVGNSSGTVTIDVPTTITSWTMTLPATDGAANQLLITDGAGNLSFASLGASGIADDSLDWAQFVDAMTLDATTTIDMDTNTADFNFDSNTFVIDSSANSVGFGDASPDSTLDVDGGVNFDLAAGSQFVIDANTADTTVDAVYLDIATTTNSVDGAFISYTGTDVDTAAALNIDFNNDESTAGADTNYGILLTVDNNTTTTDDTVYGLYIDNENSGDSDADKVADALIYLDNSDTADALPVGILFNDAGGGTTTGIDLTDTGIVTAIDINSNLFLFDEIRVFEGSTGTLTFEDTSGNDLATIVDSGSGGTVSTGDLTLGLNDASATLSTVDTNESLTLDPNGSGDIYFHGSTYNLSDSGDLTLGGRITFENSEYISNETDDLFIFQGASGADDTNVYFDLDGSNPLIYSGAPSDDTIIGIDDSLHLTGQADLEGYASVGNGSALSADETLIINRTFTATAGSSAYQTHILGNITENTSGTHTTIAPLAIDAITVTDGAGTEVVTNLASFYIAGAPTAGTTPTNGPYSIFVDAGSVRFDGTTVLNTVDYTWPSSDGGASQVLSTNASGTLSWIDVSAGAGTHWTDGGTTLYVTATSDDVAIGGSDSDSELFFDTSAAALNLNPYGTSAGNTGEIRLQELEANGDNYTGFKSPDTLAGNVIYTLPTADATVANRVLASDTAGNLSWIDVSAGSGSLWSQTSGVLYPTTITDDLAIGGTDSTADFFVSDNGKLVFNASTTGTYVDFVLETQWTTGTLINADFASSTTLSGSSATGLNLDLNTNVTGLADTDVTGVSTQTPALTSSGATTTNFTGYTVTGGALDTSSSGSDTTNMNWYGLDITIPNIDTGESGDTTSAYGIRITPGTVTAGSGTELEYGILVDAVTGDIVGGDASGDDLLLVSTTDSTKGDIQFHSGSYTINSTGDITLGGRTTFENSEYISNETDDLLIFAGAGGTDNTDLYVDLDGSYPILYSNTDSLVGFSDDITVVKADPAIVFDVTTATDTDFWVGVIDDAGGDDDDVFQIGDGTTVGTNPFVTVDTSGNVGIGTVSPSWALEVNGIITTGNDIRLEYAFPEIKLIDSDDSSYEWRIQNAYGNNTNFQIQDITAGNKRRFVIRATGLTGIGGNDESPDAHLEVSAEGTTGGSAFMVSANDDGDGDLFIVQEDGNVGIGDTTPDDTLDVDGGVNFDLAAASAFVIDADTTNTTVTSGVIDINVGTSITGGFEAINTSLTVDDGATATDNFIGHQITLQADDADADLFGMWMSNTATTNAAAGSYQNFIRLVNNEDTAGAVTDAIYINSNSGTDGDIVDAIDASNSGITNALNVGPNIIKGTTATIDFTNYDLSSTGATTITPDTTGTYLDFVLETEWTAGDLINIDFASATTLTSAATGIDLDFTNVTADGSNALYGLHINDNETATASTEYGIYQEGTTWDYGAVFEDAVLLGNNGADFSLVLYSEQGGTDYTTTLAPHATMTESVTYTLPAADATSNNQVLGSDTSGNLSWIDVSAGSGNLWQDSSNVINPTTSTDDFAIGGTTLAASIFSIDESAGIFLFGGDQSSNPTLRFEATDSDTGDFGFSSSDAFYFTGANVGIGTTSATTALDVAGGSITLENDEVIGNSTDDLVTFVGGAGTDNTDLYIDLDGSYPILYSNTDSLVGFSDDITVVKADPAIVFDVTTATDTDFWVGVIDDAGGDDDDIFQIGDGTTVGTNPFVTVDTSGNVGIGDTAPSAKLDVESSITDTSGTSYAALITNQADASSASTATHYGLQSLARLDTTNGPTSMIGAYGIASLSAAGTVNTLYGLQGKANTVTGLAATITTYFGVNAVSDVEDATVTNAGGVRITTPSVDTGSLADGYGVFIDEGTVGSGSMTEQRGINIQAMNNATDNWGIWGDGGDWVLDVDGDGASGGTTGGGDIFLGEGQDLELYHDGTNSYITNNTGDLYIGDASTDNVILSNNGGSVFLGDTANANVTQGLTINQGVNDDEIIALKSSDVSHGVTSTTEADTFGYFKKLNASAGGLAMRGISDNASAGGIRIHGTIGSEDPTDTIPTILLKATKLNGTDNQKLGDDETVLQIDNRTTNLVTILGDGAVGIGDTTPTETLTVADDLSGFAGSFFNDGNADTRQGVFIQGCLDTNPTTACNLLEFRDGNGTVLGAVEGDGAGGVTNASAGSDYAELFDGDRDNVEKGDIIGLDENGIAVAATAQTKIIGAYSTNPSSLGNWHDGWEDNEDVVPVGLLGQLDIKVSVQNGGIKKGDPITASSDQPGVGVKATSASRILGFAMEETNDDDQIRVYISPTWHNPSAPNNLTDDTNSTETPPAGDTLLAEIQEVYEEFKTFTETLGLAVSTDEDGNELLTVSSDLSVLGNTILTDLTVTGNLQAGLLTIDTVETSVDVLGASCYNPSTDSLNKDLCEAQTLYLQKELAGGIDIFDGTLVIRPDGHLSLDGILIATEIETQKLTIDTTDTDAQTAGTAKIKAGDTTVKIDTSALQEGALVLVTPTTVTGKQAVIVSDKKEGEYFEVSIEEEYDNDIKFDWLIVNTTN